MFISSLLYIWYKYHLCIKIFLVSYVEQVMYVHYIIDGFIDGYILRNIYILI